MINWSFIVMLTGAVFLGSNLGLRGPWGPGRQVIFQPLWSYRVLTLLVIFGIVLFLEAARAALTAPTIRHFWFLIAGGVCAFGAAVIQLLRELQLAKREIERLKAGC